MPDTSSKLKIPLSIPNICGKEWEYVKECLDTGWVSAAGDFIPRFERSLSAYTGSPFACACVNGTCGLQIALELCGVGPGDEVIVPALTFIAPINAVRYRGAEPVFMDCDEFMNMDPDKLEEFCRQECRLDAGRLVNRLSGRLIKAVLPVHVFGNPCRMDTILETAPRFGLKVVEDATESLGSRYSAGPLAGRHAGTLGDFGVFSFNANKIITTGNGGMIVTSDRGAAAEAAYLINQAKDDPFYYRHDRIGYNYRLSNIQAAMGLAQMESLDKFLAIKKKNYNVYARALAGVPGITLLGSPEGTAPNCWFYSILVERRAYGRSRDELAQALQEAGAQCRPVWHLNHLQKPYARCQAYAIRRAPWFLERVLNIPCSTSLKEDEAMSVASLIRELRTP